MFPFWIFLSHDIRVRRQGDVLRSVDCEHCGTRFCYCAVRRGTGEAAAPFHVRTAQQHAQAEEDAQADLVAQLQTAIDPVPCPACGMLQGDMVRALRRARSSMWLAATIPVALSNIVVYALGSGLLRVLSDTVMLAAMAVPWGIMLFLLAWIYLGDLNANPRSRTREALGEKCRALPVPEPHSTPPASSSPHTEV